MAKLDLKIIAHLEWLGYVQPTGLVVSAPALVKTGAILERSDIDGQQRLRGCIEERRFAGSNEPAPWLPDFTLFAQTVLDWSFKSTGYAGTGEDPIPDELTLALPDYGETLRPDYAVKEFDPPKGGLPWQLLVRVLEPGQDFDHKVREGGTLEASPHSRLERLLRHTGVSAGLLFNGRALRLVSAPRGESSGWLDFRVADMALTAGRPICTALRLLLCQERLLSMRKAERLAALLEESRKFQNEVSERLAEQVLHALYELLRGFQAAHDASGGKLLRDPLQDHPDEVYRALLTLILRLVFLLYSEERDMLPGDETWLRHYSLAGLYERLREDAALYPDTMDQRFGAWAQLLVLFRMVFDGAEFNDMRLPRRHGVLFDPDRFPFLEGRPSAGGRQQGERVEAPLVPDGTIYRALEKLLVLDGERISYRALDVEQIGSVYETMMGFRLERAQGRSLAIKAQKRLGAPTTVDLDALLAQKPAERKKWLEEHGGRKFPERVHAAVKVAGTLEDLHAALEKVADLQATPDLVPPNAMILQPSPERRRSGSHYTPRTLTEPIVRTTLEPILAHLRGADGRAPRPEQLLDLKVCDPAMGSGAFLVEACRQLGDALLESWQVHGGRPALPPDEDEVIFARRLVAQRCLYGVDRNPVAVDLAKVSLWLATLAKDHALTFVDHALRHGDSLVGLSRAQIEAFHWDLAKTYESRFTERLRGHVDKVAELRRRIREADEGVSDWELQDLWDEALTELGRVRLFGDLVLAAYFMEERPAGRESKRSEYANAIMGGDAERHRDWLEELRQTDPPLTPFHWELEFPEVFGRKNPGFDALVGNPPFAGKNTLAAGNLKYYPDWLKHLHPESHGNADLVAHFFRRAFDLARTGGAFGLIATNTIAQGDTRSTGLRWICTHGGEIYCARKRVKWPGQAAVVVSVLHMVRGPFTGLRRLDEYVAETITAFLFHRGSHDDPAQLVANADKSFQGSIVLGMGFTFDDTDTKGIANSLESMKYLIAANPKNKELIFPYIGGEEINSSPTHAHHRYVINFSDYPLCRDNSLSSWFKSDDQQKALWRRNGVVPGDYPYPVAADWPELLAIVEERVKPERDYQKRDALRNRWWQYAEKRPGLVRAIIDLKKVLAHAFTSKYLQFAFIPSDVIIAGPHSVFTVDTFSAFAFLQSRCHEVWVRFTSSTMKDDLGYKISDSFETFPFHRVWMNNPIVEEIGRYYYEFRAKLMLENDQGLTETYNRFHDPDERDPGIFKLRELHAAMDRAVLDAYGWTEISTDCEFLLDYEEDDVEEGVGQPARMKPWRYRWPDEVRDEVLARLLELNAERAREEARAGATGGTDLFS
jgi:hypothetical protein